MNKTSPDYIDAPDLKRCLETYDTIELVDARDPEEYAAGHVPGSMNIPIADLAEMVRNGTFAQASRVVTLCGSTGRGERAAEVLGAAGVKGVRVLRGCLKGWREAGLPVE